MQPTSPDSTLHIPVPEVDSDEPVAVVPVASVAPLDGPPDGERITTFALEPVGDEAPMKRPGLPALAAVREGVMGRPLTYAGAALALGFLISRLTR